MDTKTLDHVFWQTRNNMMRFLHGDDYLIAQLPRELPEFLLANLFDQCSFEGCSPVVELLYRQFALSAFIGSIKLDTPPQDWRQTVLLLSEHQLNLAREKFPSHKLLVLALRYALAASQLAEPENNPKREVISNEIDNLGPEVYGQWQPLYATPTSEFFYHELELHHAPKDRAIKALTLAELSAKTADWEPIQQISGNQMKNPGPSHAQLLLLRDRFIEEMKQRFPCFVTAGFGQIGMENGILAFYDGIPFNAPTEFNGALVRNEEYRQAISELLAAKQKGLPGISA